MIIETIPAETIITLPSPNLGNAHALDVNVSVKRMMDGSINTYVKKTSFKTYRYTFLLTRGKALEVLEFFKIYAGTKLKVTNDNASFFVGYILLNPLELEMQRRAVAQNSVEDLDLELSFEQTE